MIIFIYLILCFLSCNHVNFDKRTIRQNRANHSMFKIGLKNKLFFLGNILFNSKFSYAYNLHKSPEYIKINELLDNYDYLKYFDKNHTSLIGKINIYNNSLYNDFLYIENNKNNFTIDLHLNEILNDSHFLDFSKNHSLYLQEPLCQKILALANNYSKNKIIDRPTCNIGKINFYSIKNSQSSYNRFILEDTCDSQTEQDNGNSDDDELQKIKSALIIFLVLFIIFASCSAIFCICFTVFYFCKFFTQKDMNDVRHEYPLRRIDNKFSYP